MRLAFVAAAVAALSLAASSNVQAQNQQGQVVFRTPQEAVKYYEDLVGQLSLQVRNMQDENAKLYPAMADMQAKIQSLSQSNQSLAAEVAALKKQVAAESSARQEQMNSVVDKVKGAISSASAAAASERAAAERASAAQASEMIEVTVPAGATLSLIASTYKVSVDEIKKANNLKSDTLRVGQKLLVPKK